MNFKKSIKQQQHESRSPAVQRHQQRHTPSEKINNKQLFQGKHLLNIPEHIVSHWIHCQVSAPLIKHDDKKCEQPVNRC